jgi:hypothetical protein
MLPIKFCRICPTPHNKIWTTDDLCRSTAAERLLPAAAAAATLGRDVSTMSLWPADGVRVAPGPHPSNGGTPYPPEMRELMIWRYLNNLSLNTPEINAIRADKVFPSLSTCNNSITQYVEEGTPTPRAIQEICLQRGRFRGHHLRDCSVLGCASQSHLCRGRSTFI